MKIKTFKKTPKGEPRGAYEWDLHEWKPGSKLYISPWRDGINSLRMGSTVRFPATDLWSFGCGSVYRWIDNIPYSNVVPDRNDPTVYFLRAGTKHCAGVASKARDIYVNGDWFYYIDKFKVISKKSGVSNLYGYSFVVASPPQDVPALVKEANKAANKQYYGAMTVGDFEILISHASETKRRWLNKTLIASIKEAVQKASDKATNECTFEP